MKPPKSILDPTFKYTPAAKTSLAKTFRRIRRELEEAQKAKPKAPVTDIKRRTR